MITSFASSLRKTIEREALFAPHCTVIVGVSGGADSVALLAALAELREPLGIRLIAAHLDHALRPDSAAAASHVRRLATLLEVEHQEMRLPWEDLSLRPRSNVEAAAREERYAFLLAVAAEHENSIVAVAHQADDVLETFLAQLIRGAGPRGLSHPRFRRADGIVRPMLEKTRAEILQYLRERNLAPFDDPTNADGSNLRSRLRRDVVPLLARENPSIARATARTARLLAGLDDGWSELARQLLDEITLRRNSSEIVLDATRCRTYDPTILSTILREALTRVRSGLPDSGFESLAEVAGAWREGSRFAVDLPRGARIVVGGDVIRIFQDGDEEAPKTLEMGPRELPIPGSLRWFVSQGSRGGLATELRGSFVSSVPSNVREISGPSIAWLDADQVSFPFKVRVREPGDRYRPLGLRGTAKLHDLLIDRKIPCELRDSLPVVLDDQGIVWVPGLRVDERARITPRTRRAVRVEAISSVPVLEGDPA
ncbi:MAG TPA: tRNA lysidine(34) synthetase TilS [bacterium]|nr:tRNA lysidine(34) synthetase TilS [bacterium]